MGKNQRAQGLGFLISARLLAQLAVPLSLTAFRSALHNDLSLEAGVGGRWAAPGGPTTLRRQACFASSTIGWGRPWQRDDLPLVHPGQKKFRTQDAKTSPTSWGKEESFWRGCRWLGSFQCLRCRRLRQQLIQQNNR